MSSENYGTVLDEIENVLDVNPEVIEERIGSGEKGYSAYGDQVLVEGNSWEAEFCRVLSYDGRAEISITGEGPAYELNDDRLEEWYVLYQKCSNIFTGF